MLATKCEIKLVKIPILRTCNVLENTCHRTPYFAVEWTIKLLLRCQLQYSKQILAGPLKQSEPGFCVPITQGATIIFKEGVNNILRMVRAGK